MSTTAEQYECIPKHDGNEWYTVRLQRLKAMWSKLLIILLIMGLLTSLERNPLNMVAPERCGCPAEFSTLNAQDYGLFYHTGYAIAYIFDCIFLSIWVPFFSGWVKELPVSNSTLDSINQRLLTFNRASLGLQTAYQASIFLCNLFAVVWLKNSITFSPSFSKVPRTPWTERLYLVVSSLAAVCIGSAALHTLEDVEMVKVKTLEYVLVIVPAQILVGLSFASKAQQKREQRILAGKAAARHVEMGAEAEKAGI